MAAPEAEPSAELQEIHKATEETLREVEELKTDIARMRAGIEALQIQFASYRDEYRRITRLTAVGDTYQSLSCLDGREFKDVTVREVDAVGLSIRHQAGTARVEFRHLPHDFQLRFQWDAQEAAEVLQREAEDSAAWERRTRIAYQRNEERRAKQAAEDREDERLRLLALKARNAIAATKTSRLDVSGPLGTQRSLSNRYRYDRYDRYDSRYRNTTWYPNYCRSSSSRSRTNEYVRTRSQPQLSNRNTPSQQRVWNRVIPSRRPPPTPPSP